MLVRTTFLLSKLIDTYVAPNAWTLHFDDVGLFPFQRRTQPTYTESTEPSRCSSQNLAKLRSRWKHRLIACRHRVFGRVKESLPSSFGGKTPRTTGTAYRLHNCSRKPSQSTKWKRAIYVLVASSHVVSPKGDQSSLLVASGIGVGQRRTNPRIEQTGWCKANVGRARGIVFPQIYLRAHCYSESCTKLNYFAKELGR